ncbi:P-loop containing dynein motor region D3-domain-containing protein, partial [Baffinella frigidus]
AQDLPLFEGISKDLFPGIELPKPDYVNMLASMNWACEGANLQPEKYFLQKTIELYEMIVVRHGLMVVGMSYGGKTCSYRVLAETLGKLNELGQNDEQKVKILAMNPKSITMGQLYGQFDPTSHEQSDTRIGQSNTHIRQSNTDKWDMFDGPVDAIWIENMNTVLDDNKKLCLVSGEIIQMSSTMNMIFEPQDLEVASPATVSRCGMVYYEPHQMGLYPSLSSWLNTLPETITTDQRGIIESLFKWLVPPTLKFLRKELREVSPSSDVMMGWGLMKLFESLLQWLVDPKTFQMSEKDAVNKIEGIFLFCLTWSPPHPPPHSATDRIDRLFSMGAVDVADRNPKPESQIPKPGTETRIPIPESRIPKHETRKWALWTSLISREPFPVTMESHEIVVPTIDTTRYTYWLDVCCQNAVLPHTLNRICILFVGPTGTGKTIYINKHLLTGLNQDKFTNINLGFSAQTTAAQTQDIIDGKLDKRRKGVYGPPMGKKCIVFVDDLNMPTKEEYGAQPPVELLRQYMDFGGWYDNKEKVFRNIVDMMYVVAMGPPGGGRTFVTPRFLRWFNVISVTEFDGEAMTSIFDAIMKFQFDKKGTPGVVKGMKDNMLKSTLEVYDQALLTLLPTPAKSHYLFNLRDFGRVINGILMTDTEVMTDGMQVVRLWLHETMRVFYDRLTDDKDRTWLIEFLRTTIKKNFSFDLDKLMEHLVEEGEDSTIGIGQARRLLFGDFGNPEGKRVYCEMPVPSRVIEVCDTFLQDYNAMSKKPMQLVLFLFMIEHVTRICRVLRSPGGNALLVGVGGSGRQSCTRLASFISDFSVIEIEISKTYGKPDWREDLKRLLTNAGGDGKETTFLFTGLPPPPPSSLSLSSRT